MPLKEPQVRSGDLGRSSHIGYTDLWWNHMACIFVDVVQTSMSLQVDRQSAQEICCSYYLRTALCPHYLPVCHLELVVLRPFSEIESIANGRQAQYCYTLFDPFGQGQDQLSTISYQNGHTLQYCHYCGPLFFSQAFFLPTTESWESDTKVQYGEKVLKRSFSNYALFKMCKV